MWAIRKIPPKMVSVWEGAIIAGSAFDTLPIALIKDWIEEDNTVSIYVVDDLAKILEAAMALTIVTGGGPKGAAFIVVPYAELKSAGLTLHKTSGSTLLPTIDALHEDVKISKGADLRKLIETFVQFGVVKDADSAKVKSLAVQALKADDYSIASLAAKLKDPIRADEIQKVCNSTLRLVGSGDLAIN